MKFERVAGVLLHPTSLPGKYGIGTIGKEALNFVDFLEHSGQKLWQVFPLGPTGYGDSPYQSFSAFAGNPLLIDLELLLKDNFLSDEDLAAYPHFDDYNIDFGKLIKAKNEILYKAYNNSKNKIQLDEYNNFCKKNAEWLEDYTLFMAVKDYHNGKLWTEWEEDIAFRLKGAVNKWQTKLKNEIDYHKFVQYIFHKQWENLKNYANSKGIKIIGDIPIFIAYDSVDLWANKHLFSVNEKGKLLSVAGVPPDYFSPTGQLWGNPLYKWDEMEKDNFLWWQKRIKKVLEFVDIIRIDHFRGFDAYWEIPGNAPTAETGKWVKAPGHKFFSTIKKEMGDLPILAEDLGIITKSVEKLRDDFNFPGMKILQFAFGNNGEKKFLPHNHIKNCVVYTGSHDNDTTKGFFEKEKQSGSGIFEWAQKYLDFYNDNLTLKLIKTAYASVAKFVIIPMQDILNLGSEARMNFPGKLGGNWTWRFTWEQVENTLPQEYKELTVIYERPPVKKETIDNNTPDEFLPE